MKAKEIDRYLQEIKEEFSTPEYFYIIKREEYELEEQTPENPDLLEGWNSFWIRRLAYLILRKEGRL